jgi:hypothetical protein
MDFKLSAEQIDIKNAAKEFALGEFPDRAQEQGELPLGRGVGQG